MSNTKNQSDLCKNIFRNGENSISSEKFTQKWLELINQLEKNKEINIMKN